MEKYFSQIVSYLIHVFQASFNQLFVLFGPLLILALFLNFSAGLTARLSLRFWGRTVFLYGFGWFGCSIHELSHAFFALIFGHKIREIALFEPNSNGESLGHVSHSFNKRSIYQKIGNFFIGIGPLLAGGIVLFLITLILYRITITDIFRFQISTAIFSERVVVSQFFKALWSGLIAFRIVVFEGFVHSWWKSVLFCYVLYSTGSSMTLSKSDVKGALSGFLWLILLVLIFNLLTLWISNFGAEGVVRINTFISAFYFLLVLSFIANVSFSILFFILNLLKNIFVHR